MKSIKYIVIVILAFSTSCSEDFLDIEPETDVSLDNFYKSASDFEQAIIGTYAPLQDIYAEDWEMTELRSDNTYFSFDIANRGTQTTEDLATFTVETNNETVRNKWANNFLIISRANQILSAINEVDIEDSDRNLYSGEAHFLRGLAYFDLLKNFGGVPLYLEPPTSFEATFKQRATYEEVLQQSISDAQAAASELPSYGEQVLGRATSEAAYTLLADIFISQDRWSDAESALNNVLNSGHNLLPDYSNIFSPGNEGNAEIIFEVNYLDGTSQDLASTFPYQFLPELADPSVITGVAPAARNGGGSFNVPTPELLSAYEDPENDKRFAASIAFYSGASPLVGITYDSTPYINKYQHPHSIPNETGQNWIIYRYAEVLLMMSEALVEQGRGGEALNYINQVRTRAGLTPLASVDKDAVLNERRIELAFENKRWYDLVRTGRAVSTMNAFGNNVKNNPSDYYYPEGSGVVDAAFNVSEMHLVYPIPASEIIINPELEQNTGY